MTNISVVGQESYFNEDAKFFKDLYIYGRLYYEFESNETEIFGDIEVRGQSIFNGPATFNDNVTINGELETEYLTVRKRLDVGIGGTVLTASTENGNVGIGTTIPEQAVDISGSIKIDENIYDSVNTPGKNGYQLSRDASGIRWIPLIADGASSCCGFGTIVGISTYSEGIFVLNEGVPLYPE